MQSQSEETELFSTPTLTVLPGASVWEGEAVTLQCGAHINKQGTQLQYRYSKDNGTVRGAGSQDQHSIPAAGLRDTGRYQCEVEAAGTGLKKRSASVSLTVRELFSTPTLTVLPGASVWEGEAVTLQCGAHINKQGTQLQYRYMKDKRYLSGAGSQDRHSIPSAELNNSGNYLCDVEAVELGKNKQSDSVSLTVKESALSVKVYGAHQHTLILYLPPPASWQSAAAAGFSVGFFVILLLIVFTLLLLHHKIRGFPCITGGKRSDTWRGGECGIIAEVKLIKPGVSHYCHRERSDQNQDQAAGGVELSSQAQQPVHMCSCPWLSWCKSVSSELFGEQEDCGAELLLKPEDPPQSVGNS
ncbi:UNVERIFIED_CONTAM: hypothetical protein FKN15_067733 [Acipenser sinensis]